MIKKITLLLSTVVLSIYIQAQSFTATYTFDSVKTTSGLTDPTAVPTAANVTFGSFSAIGTPTNPNAAARFSFTGWPTGSINGDSLFSQLTGAISTSEYYEVTMTPATNYTLTLSSVTFKIQRSSTGIRTYAVRSNADGYAANLSASINPANAKLSVQSGDIFFVNKDSTTTAQTGSTITLSGAPFINSLSPLTFRFYGWNSESSGGTFSIDTVSFTGSAVIASINDLSSEALMSIYPNPSANGLFTVDLSNVSSKTNVTIYNIIGGKILEKEINAFNKQLLDLSNQANGCYFVTIKNDNSTTTRKITINK